MKHFSFIFLTLLCVMFLSSCKSDLEKTINKYAHEKDLHLIQSAIYENTHNGYVSAFYVKNINETPVDTLYTWEAYEQSNEVQIALDNYHYFSDLATLDSLTNYKNDMIAKFGNNFDHTKIDKQIFEAKTQLYNDSISYANTIYELSLLKQENAIMALGYEFDEEFRCVIDNEESIETIHKIIYIMSSGEVYNCVLNLNK